MQYRPRDEERSGLLIRLTDFALIAAEVDWLRSEGYTELAVWRHFLEHFVVDLDALSLIIAKLFEHSPPGERPLIAAAEPRYELHRAA